MARFSLASLALGFVVAALASAEPGQGATADVGKIVQGNNAFALDLYGQLAKENDGNLFFSPYSISTALAMTYAGARGETAAEMAKTLHLPLGQETLHPAFGRLIAEVNGKGTPRKYELTTVNRLWGQKGYPYLPEFLKLTQDSYGAGLKEVDFVRETEQARQAINGWVEEQTKKKIQELLKPGILTVDTRLVLTNAIYFKADWAEPFGSAGTKPGEFRLSAAKSVGDVPLMSKTSFRASYHDAEQLQILAMPYVNNDLSMIVVLPKAIDGLQEVEKALKAKPGQLGDWLSKLQPAVVEVTLPKFKLTKEFLLNKQLKALGINAAFGNADFSGITTAERLFISAVVHKAFVDVNEAGTEAAAATAVVMNRDSSPGQVVQFRADHPFLFALRDNRSGSILFMGRLVNPKD